ncbi:MAG TPA: sulfotransferase [Caulobacteraceae bacterium]|jgi:hypothetical protein|nr:sulfotransferase [Caulobacteraceae bacterium]
MASLEVPNKYLALAPIIVTSPTARCGTTLVQRLLTASDNGFVFGEELGNQVRVLTNWFVGEMQRMERTGAQVDEEFRQALEGRPSDWRPGLLPPSQVMMKAWVETYYQLPSVLASYAESVGRPRWGFKYPAFTRDAIKALLSLMPQARVVYVFRNLHDVLKSAKARRFVNTPQETVEFCAQWADNMNEIAPLVGDDRILFLKYEDFVAGREAHVQFLEQRLGVTGMDASVFDAKVNTFKGEEEAGFSPSGYIAPAPLTDEDRATISVTAGPVLDRLYDAA